MGTFWLKVAVIMIVIIAGVIIILKFLPSKQEPEPKLEPQKTFYDVAREDKEKFLSKPESVDSIAQRPQPGESKPKPPQTVTLYFRELSEIDDIEAERLLNVAAPGRSIGRLPMTGFNLMVDTCRQIIRNWPDSWYAYRAKQMLADMPERFRTRYKITKDEMDISRFAEPRQGTTPFEVKSPN